MQILSWNDEYANNESGNYLILISGIRMLFLVNDASIVILNFIRIFVILVIRHFFNDQDDNDYCNTR